MFGHKYMGNERTTVIVDPKGKVAKIFPKVQIDGHVEEVERALREIA
jgi:peroxiredoxin Q/BCP